MIIKVLTYFELLVLVLLCLYTDISSRKIPNIFTLPAVIIGCFTNLALNGLTGLFDSVKGMLAALVLGIIPFVIRGLGGGDIKLLVAIGAIKGFQFNVNTLIYTAIAGALVALLFLIYKKRMRKGLKNIKAYLIATMYVQELLPIEHETENLYFPYGIAITLGVIAASLKDLGFTNF